jgi:dihydrofolate synthase/folylpolyglutamate synthase
VISAPQRPEALAVIKRTCRLSGAELVLAGKDITWKRLGGNLNGQSFIVRSGNDSYTLQIPLLGDYQMENAGLAVAAVEALRQRGAKISREHIASGLKKVRWPARLQILNKAPLLVIDGAHNAYSMNVLLKSIKKYFTYNRLIIIFGSSGDKDIQGMAGALAGAAWKVIVTSSGHPRAAAARQLAGIFRSQGVAVEISGDALEALSSAFSASSDHDLILATGSLFLAADVARDFKEGNFR